MTTFFVIFIFAGWLQSLLERKFSFILKVEAIVQRKVVIRMDQAQLLAEIDALQEGNCYVLDIFPQQVPAGNPNYGAVENFLLKGKTLPRYAERVGIIIFKLLCYEEADILLVDAGDDDWFKPYSQVNLAQIPLEQLATLIKAVITRDSGAIKVLFRPSRPLISIDGAFQTSVYNADPATLRRIALLAQAEGIFFRGCAN